jgi:hypothetical protein
MTLISELFFDDTLLLFLIFIFDKIRIFTEFLVSIRASLLFGFESSVNKVLEDEHFFSNFLGLLDKIFVWPTGFFDDQYSI